MNRNFKNLLVGFGSILAIAPNTNYATTKHSDCEKLSNDWWHIGNDLRKAIDISRDEHE